MRKGAVVGIFVVAFTGTSAFGGAVFFGPETVYVDAGTPAVFEVGVQGIDDASNLFQAVQIVLGSLDALPLTVEYNADWLASTSLTPGAPGSWGIYATPGGTDMVFGGNNFGGWNAPLTVAALTVDTTGLADGTYDIIVSPSEEFQYAGSELSGVQLMGGSIEAISGIGHIVIPEPATLLLLGLGGMVALRRRR